MKQIPDLEKARITSMVKDTAEVAPHSNFHNQAVRSHSTRKLLTYNNLQPFFASGASPQLNCTADV